jgi:hypothetical protein
MFSTGVPKGTNPTIFACVMTVVCLGGSKHGSTLLRIAGQLV